MRASELINELKKAVNLVGDLPVKIDSAGQCYNPDNIEVTTYKDYVEDGMFMLTAGRYDTPEKIGKYIIVGNG